MKYIEPENSAAYPDRNGTYVTGSPSQGIPGSTVPGPAIECTQREIINAIQSAGLTPDGSDMTQLAQAISILMPAITPGMKIIAGMPLWQPGQTLLPNCKWGNRSLVLLADWPELKASVDAGYLDILAATSSTTTKTAYPRFWVWNSTGTGLYLPDIGGRFPRDWRSGQSDDSGRAAGSLQSDAIRDIVGALNAADGQALCRTTSGAFTITTYYPVYPMPIATTVSGVSTVTFKASSAVPTAAENRPINDAVPVAIYMGNPAS